MFFKSEEKNIARESIVTTTTIQTKQPASSTIEDPSTETTEFNMFINDKQRRCVSHLPSEKKTKIRGSFKSLSPNVNKKT